jgi:hypothetical protein
MPQEKRSSTVTRSSGSGEENSDSVSVAGSTKAKPVVFPEWGLADRSDGHGMGDDPVFIQQMAGWISSHDVAFDMYFNFDPPGQQDSITDGRFPRALAEFRAVFG